MPTVAEMRHCFCACDEQMRTGSCACTRALATEAWVDVYGSCEFACGPQADGIHIVLACPKHGHLDLTRPHATAHDLTIEAQAKLLLRVLREGSVDIVDGRMAVVAGLELAPGEESLVRLITG